ncbi:MAG: hypothetical protein DCF22_25670, partial [Leptolyngbya sp.]
FYINIGFNLTLTDFSDRLLVRQSLSFSKKLDNHIGAIWNFIHHYNQKIREKLRREQMTPFSPSFT